MLVNQNANFQFTIVQGSTTVTSLYVETHTTQSDDLAQVVLQVGQGSTVSGDFSQIDWSLGSYYLARFYEETGETKKAMKTYKSAYGLKEIGGITTDLMLEKADEIKADFGY